MTWDANMQKAVDGFKFNKPKPYTARYVGSMVADVHRTLMYGGIYMYPADAAKVSLVCVRCIKNALCCCEEVMADVIYSGALQRYCTFILFYRTGGTTSVAASNFSNDMIVTSHECVMKTHMLRAYSYCC